MIKPALVDKIEIWGFESALIIFKDFSLGAVLEISPRDISCSTDEDLNRYHGSLCQFLNSLPSGLSCQFVQSTEQDTGELLKKHRVVADTAPELARRLVESRTRKFEVLNEQGLMPAQRTYLVVRRKFVRASPEQKAKSRWFRKKVATDFSSDLLETEITLFKQLLSTVKASLSGVGIACIEKGEQDVFDLLFDQWNPNHPIGGVFFDSEDIRDDLLLNDLVISTRGFMIGQTHHRVLSLKMMPEQTFASMSEHLRRLPFGSRLFLTIEVLDQDREDLALQTQRRISYAMYAGKKGVSDLESAAKLADLESVLAKRVSGETKIFSVALNIVLRDQSESELDTQVSDVLQKMRELSGAEGMVESLAASEIFFSLALPNARARERSRRMTTEVLADFLPVFGEWRGHKEPRLLLQNRSGGLIGFDPFSPTLTNFNQIISGGSGAGKSFLTNLLIAQVLKDDPKVFIIDIGGSYRNLTRQLGGQYIPIGSDSNLSLNPFDLSATSLDAINQKIKFMTSLVELMAKEDAATGLGKLEMSEIESAIKEIMAAQSSPRLSHLREALLKILKPHWHGSEKF